MTRTFKPALTYPLRAFLDLSTAHLRVETLKRLNERPASEWEWPMYPTEYGFFMYADEAPGEHVPEEIAAAMRKARDLGAEYVLYDCDAPEQPALLPTFEH